ncbi:MAG: MFS transporter, partial [Paracoccaceae bacterium]
MAVLAVAVLLACVPGLGGSERAALAPKASPLAAEVIETTALETPTGQTTALNAAQTVAPPAATAPDEAGPAASEPTEEVAAVPTAQAPAPLSPEEARCLKSGGSWNSGGLVGAMVFAQLGPLLLLSIPGSVLANRAPRKPWLLTMPTIQMFAAFAMAGLVASDAGYWWIFLANAVMGCANAMNAPAFQSSIPLLVHRRDLPGAIALNTAQLNGTRVIGPLIVGLLTLFHITVSQM